jgi:osmotically-inducible protein OsmY
VTPNRKICCALLVAGLFLTCASLCRADAEQDRRLEERLRMRFTGQVALHVESLGIEVQEGVVHLSGTVGSLGEKVRAERLPGAIVGVQEVVSDLVIRKTDRSELAIAQEVQQLLARPTRFRKPPLQVTVVGTEVTLGGLVDRALDRIDAEEIAQEALGVTRVHNNIQIRNESSLTNESLRTRVLGILTNPLTFGVVRHLEVTVDQGMVTLEGRVSLEPERREAERLTLSVPGVMGVVNQIKVGSGS